MAVDFSKVKTSDLLWLPAKSTFYTFHLDKTGQVWLDTAYTCDNPLLGLFIQSAEILGSMAGKREQSMSYANEWLILKDWLVVNVLNTANNTTHINQNVLVHKKNVWRLDKENNYVVDKISGNLEE